MIKKSVAAMMALGISTAVMAGGSDDPLLYEVIIGKLELKSTGKSNPLVLDAATETPGAAGQMPKVADRQGGITLKYYNREAA